MKTFLRVAAVVFILLLALPFMLQLRGVTLENGEWQVLYVPMDGGSAGGSVGADLREELEAFYGEEGISVESDGIWKQEKVVLEDTYEYQLEYMGKAVNGRAEYILCTVVTNRTVRNADTDEKVTAGMQVSTLLARNELGNEKRAYVLWDTVDEKFYGGGFDIVSTT